MQVWAPTIDKCYLDIDGVTVQRYPFPSLYRPYQSLPPSHLPNMYIDNRLPTAAAVERRRAVLLAHDARTDTARAPKTAHRWGRD